MPCALGFVPVGFPRGLVPEGQAGKNIAHVGKDSMSFAGSGEARLPE